MCSPNQKVCQQQKHPRRKVTLQRHTTLPGPLRSLPITKSSRKNSSNTLLQKNNPYVGWFRHAPPRRHRINKHHLLKQQPRKVVFTQHQHCHSRQWYQERGLLRGGTSFLAKDLSPQDIVGLSDDDDDDTDSGETFDDEFTFVDDDASIRSDTRLDLLYVDPQERLDYNITQMDIVRMNRLASRHLDVESIANLPVVTYQGPSIKKENASSGSNNKAFSWMLVHSDSEASDNETEDTDDSNPMCIICCETFVQGDRLRVLPCSHSFHTGCIDRWLSGSHSSLDCFTAGCPTCKKSIPTQSYFRVGDALASHSFMA